MTEAFVDLIMQFELDHKIDLVRFKKGQRKDYVMQAGLPLSKEASTKSGLYRLCPGKDARVPRTARNAFRGGGTIPQNNCSIAGCLPARTNSARRTGLNRTNGMDQRQTSKHVQWPRSTFSLPSR